MRIQRPRYINGQLRLPGDKSISHRAALIAALGRGTSTISNFSTASDCAATVSCLKALGVPIYEKENQLVVPGVGRQGLHRPKGPLDCGNSGTTMRLLAGVLSGQDFSSTLIGDPSLSQRPMRRVVEPLQLMGATVNSDADTAPLTVIGVPTLRAISYDLPIASAQVKSSILLAGLNAKGQTIIREKLARTRDHTERMLQWFGASVNTQAEGDHVTTLDGPVDLPARVLSIPGDISSAAYFITAAALLPDSNLVLENVGLNPTRTGFITICQALGLKIELSHQREECNEPVGDIRVSSTPTTQLSQATLKLAGPAIACVIDELPLLAVLGSQIPGGIEIRDAEELRLKESDRISATVKNLRMMGISVREYDDGLEVSPGRLRAGHIESFGDHRIAMAFTVAALIATRESTLDDEECIKVSFPEFFDCWNQITTQTVYDRIAHD